MAFVFVVCVIINHTEISYDAPKKTKFIKWENRNIPDTIILKLNVKKIMKRKKNYRNTLSLKAFVRTVLMIILAFPFFAASQPEKKIQNPYEDVDWTNYRQFKANLNTHTMVSDGWENPQSVVENYRKLAYRILAITDYDKVTYPWEEFSSFGASELTFSRIYHLVLKPLEAESILKEETKFKDVKPSEAGMVAIPGSQLLFEKHDVNSYFNDHKKSDETVFDAASAKNGLMVINHPTQIKFPVEWYVDLFKKYDQIVGMEIFNSRNRFQDECKLWDSILTITAPVRPVWGFSNDNMLSMRDLGKNWNVFILPVLNKPGVRDAMEKGTFYFVHAPEGHKGGLPPVIESIIVNQRKGEIKINATKHDSIIWVSGGKQICRGSKFLLEELQENISYIRAELHGTGNSIVCTQPFIIK